MNRKLIHIGAALAVLSVASTVRANNFPALIAAARSNFQPVGDRDVQAALIEMRSAQRAVAQFIADRPKYAMGWKEYLHWDEQNRQLASAAALDAPFWKQVFSRETISAAGLDHPAFQQHRAAMRTLINVLESAADASLHDQYQATLDRLSELLSEGTSKVDPDQAEEISQLLEQLDRQRQAPGLVEAIRESFSQRNVLIYIPEEYLAQERSGEVHRSFSVYEYIAGASVRGNGVMTAQYEWSPVANDNGATWGMNVQGDTVSWTTAHQNRVSVRSQSTIPFRSQGKVTFDISGFQVSGFSTSGRMRLRTTSIRTPFRGFRHRIARRRALKQQASSRRLSERNAKRGISDSFRREVESRLHDANRSYREEVLLSLKCFDQMPSDSMFRTTRDSVQVGLRLANSRQLAAQSGFDDFYAGRLFRLAVHQSALNNAAMTLAGKTYSLAKMLRQLQPDSQIESTDEQPDVDISFAEASPLNLSLNDGKIAVCVSGDSFRRAGQKYSAMEIVFSYTLCYEQGDLYLKLDGEPIVAHSLSPDGTRAKLGIRDLSLRRVLLSIFKRDLPEKITLDQLELPFQRELLGQLKAVHFESQDGWALLEAIRPQNLDPVPADTADTVVPVSFEAEEPAAGR